MKVLWITNGPITFHRNLLDKGTNQGGGWMDAAFDKIASRPEVELGLATIYNCTSLLKHNSSGVKCYLVPNRMKNGFYDYKNEKNLQIWRDVCEDFNPDVVHVWGSELAHSLCALMAMNNVPSIVYMQGVMSQIYNHCNAGIDTGELLKYTSIRSLIQDRGKHVRDPFEAKRVEIEKKIISISGNVFVENEWCASNCKSINPDCNVFKSMLPIKPVFAEYTWGAKHFLPHSIFTVAGGPPLKGLHIVYRALGIVKKSYPDVKLIVPGYNPLRDDTGIRKFFPSTYTKYIKSLIRENGIDNNIEFIGKVTPSVMAEQMSMSHLFVMPSAIENHSSTLIEAMMVGVPCITSYVGGISEYVRDGKNALFYRFDEPETLAGMIIKLFRDADLCKTLSENAISDTREVRLNIDIASDFINAYKNIIDDYKNKQ